MRKTKSTEKNKEQEGETSGVVFLREQKEHLKSMMAAAVTEARTAHSLKDQPSQNDINKTSKQQCWG